MNPSTPHGPLRFLQRTFSILLIAGAVLLHCGAQTPPPADPATAYVDGMEAMENGDFPLAVADLSKALAADSGNADYLRARGVANTLAEKFPEAITDLERSLRLSADDHEAKLWLAAAYRMKGDTATGAKYYSTNGVPPDYANMVYNVMAMDYWNSNTNGSYWDREQKRQVKVTAPVKKLFPKAAGIYASRHRATGAAPGRLALEKLKNAIDHGDWQAAWKELSPLRRTAPDDAALRGQLAQTLLGLGDALHAREEFTRSLCIQPLWVEGYLGRAQAAAAWGDSRRAASDLDTAASLGAKMGIPRVWASHTKPMPFADAVNADVSFDYLVDLAIDMQREFNNRRLYYDEAYQDRVRMISIAMHDDWQNAGWHELLGRFLHHNHVVPVIWNGPRATEQLRPQSTAEEQMELQRALAAEDEALKIDPRQVNALASKGWLLYDLGNPPAAEALADECLATEGKSVPGLQLKSRLLNDHASDMKGHAAALRTPHVDITYEDRSDGRYEVRHTYPPTAEALAEAAKLDEQAAVVQKEAARLDDIATQTDNEIIPGLLKDAEGLLASNMSDNAAADRADLDHAYVLNPDRQDVLLDMAKMAGQRGDKAGEQLYAMLAAPMEHTTASSELKTAYEQITHTNWKSAGASLDRAAQIDPMDARIPAYRSVIAGAQGDKTTAMRQRRAALALEEARARLMGAGYLQTGSTPVAFEEPSLTLLLRLQEGDALLEAGHADQALAAYALNLAMEPRMGKAALTGMMPLAILPDPKLEPSTIPTPPTFASLLASSHLGSGRALLALGRPADVQKEYLAVRAYLADWPATAPGRGTLNTADSWARLGQAEAAYAAKDLNTAHLLLDSGEGWPWGLPKELDQRRKELSGKVLAAMQQSGEQQIRGQQNISPQQAQIRRMQDDIAQMEKQRDNLLAEITKPETDERTRKFLQQSADELQKMIDQRKVALSRLDQGTGNSKQQ